MKAFALGLMALTAMGCSIFGPAAVPVCGYEVVAEYPHATDAYTQGLVWHGGLLYESTGIETESSLREVELETGEVLRRVDLDDEYFAEGLAVVEGDLLQLTWQAEIGFLYEIESLEQVDEVSYEGEGWGLAFDGTHLVMSDGTETLAIRDPATFEAVETLRVTADGEPVDRLNELEVIGAEIWANVWQTDRIARIDPDTGRVTSWVDLAGLLPEQDRTSETSVLNGIAFDAASDRVFVTGKNWPKLFEIDAGECVSA